MKKVLIFLFGAATGSVAMYFAIKEKYALEAQEAINEEREYYRKKCSELSQNKPLITIPNKSVDIHDDASLYPDSAKSLEFDKEKYEAGMAAVKEKLSELGYSKKEEPEMSAYAEPYEISIDEFTTFNGYAKETLTMYPDDILADENYELADVNDTVGYDMLDKLPEYDNAEIYIRNDKRKIDYTLVRETHSFEEITGIFIGDYSADDYDE